MLEKVNHSDNYLWWEALITVCHRIPHSRLHVMHCHFLSCTADTLGFPGAVVEPWQWSWGMRGVPGKQQGGAVLQLPCCDLQPQDRAACPNCITLKPRSCQVSQEGNAEIKLCYNSFPALSCLPAPGFKSKSRTPQFCNDKPSLQGCFLPSQEQVAALRISRFLSTSNEGAAGWTPEKLWFVFLTGSELLTIHPNHRLS